MEIKTVLMTGQQGDKGDTNYDNAIPVGGIIAYDGDSAPEGYTQVSSPV